MQRQDAITCTCGDWQRTSKGSDLNGGTEADKSARQRTLSLRHELWLPARWVVEGAKGLIALLIPQTQSRPLSGGGTEIGCLNGYVFD